MTDTSSHADSDDVVFVPETYDESESENVKSSGDTNTDDITEGSVETEDDHIISEDDQSDYPSNRSDIQSSIKEDNIMEQLEKEHNIPLFLSLNCTVRDKSHLSSTMVSMPAEYLPACFGKLHASCLKPLQFGDTCMKTLVLMIVCTPYRHITSNLIDY